MTNTSTASSGLEGSSSDSSYRPNFSRPSSVGTLPTPPSASTTQQVQDVATSHPVPNERSALLSLFYSPEMHVPQHNTLPSMEDISRRYTVSILDPASTSHTIQPSTFSTPSRRKYNWGITLSLFNDAADGDVIGSFITGLNYQVTAEDKAAGLDVDQMTHDATTAFATIFEQVHRDLVDTINTETSVGNRDLNDVKAHFNDLYKPFGSQLMVQDFGNRLERFKVQANRYIGDWRVEKQAASPEILQFFDHERPPALFWYEHHTLGDGK